MLTIKLPYICNDPNYQTELHELRRVQSSCYRSAYQRASEGLAELEINHYCRNTFPELDSHITQSAVRKGIGQFKSDWELAKHNKQEFTGSRIFGGKRNFFRRLKGLITHEEYQEHRLENLYVIGETSKYSNRKFNFNTDTITFKPNRKSHYELILPNLHGKYLKTYQNLVIAATKKILPITVFLNDKEISLSFDEKVLDDTKPKNIITGRYLGVDLNPNYIGVSYFNEKQELLETNLYNFKSLTGKNINADKLKHELREVAIVIGTLAQHYQIQYFFVEDLSFKQGDSGLGKNYNRLVKNQFLIREFSRMVAKFGKVVEVNAAYSSTIGNVVNEAYPDPIAASMEIARRGIESRVLKGSEQFYPPLVPKEVLQRRWKDVIIPDFSTWIELHNWLKETGLKYRVPIPSDLGMFRLFSNINSGVLILS